MHTYLYALLGLVIGLVVGSGMRLVYEQWRWGIWDYDEYVKLRQQTYKNRAEGIFINIKGQ